ncbi:MAG: glycosyltransferase family 39 protein [Thermoflexales bacterium]|nr:glycosyltransferase family 39 protein [Thermoflexales bacterium]
MRSGSRLIYIAVVGILLLAAGLRFVELVDFPPGVEHDEVAEVLIARGIWAGQHALFFREAYGQEPLFLYLVAGAFGLLGDTLFALRFVSASLGLLTVAAGFRLARRLFGPGVGLVTAGGLGVMLWPVFWSRVGLRGMTLPLLMSLGADALWRALQSSSPAASRRYALLSGLFWGLSAYTYLAARGLPILLGAFVVYLLFFDRALLRRGRRVLAVTFVLAALIAAPLAIYVGLQPDLQYRVGEVSAPLEALLQGQPGPVVANAPPILAMFSLAGDSTVRNNLPGRPVFPEPLWATLFYVGVVVAVCRVRQARYAFVLIWLGAMLSPTLVTAEAPNFTRALGALPAVMLLPGIAWEWIGILLHRDAQRRFAHRDPRRFKLCATLCSSVSLCVLLILNAGLSAYDYFARWPRLPETQFVWQTGLAAAAHSLDADPQAQDVTVAGLSNDSMDAPSLALLLKRRDLRVRWVDSGSPLGSGGALLAFPGGGRLLVPSSVPLNPALAGTLAAWGARGTEYPHFTDYRLPPLSTEGLSLTPFEANIALITATLPAAWAVPGQVLSVLSAWQAGEPPYPPLKIFIHVVDGACVVRAQHDGLDSPPQFWQPGDLIYQLHPIALPPDLQPGRYTVRLGLYDRHTLARYPLADGRDDLDIAALRVCELPP